ncbi:MAG TPA: MFS transporter [Ktedonobacteraceae bacterium]|nr:MFS transporter [Ktedonobacteraceae bacterium]
MHLLLDYIQQFGRLQRNARLYLISNALGGVSTGIVLVLYNLYLVSLGYGTDFVGAILFVGTLGAGIAIFPAGVCIDRFGGKLVMIWSSLILGLIGIGQILFRQPLPLLVTAFFAGVAGAALLVVNAPYLTANSTSDERTYLFSLNITLSLITTVLGKVLGGILPIWFRGMPALMAPLPPAISPLLARAALPRSYQLALLFAGVIAGPSLIPLFLLSSDRPTKPAGARFSERTAALSAPLPPIRQYLSKDFIRSKLAPLAGWMWLAWRYVRSRELLHNAIFLLVMVQVLIGLGAGLFIPYFNIYFVDHLGASSALFGLIDGGANALTALLTLVAPWLAQRLGKIRGIVLSELVSIPLMLTIGLTGLLPLAALLYPFRQGFMDMSNGVLQVFSMEVVPQQRRGLANSAYQAAYQVAWAITAPIGGFIIAFSGYSPIFILGACCYLSAIATLWFNFHGKRGRKAQLEASDEQVMASQIGTAPSRAVKN